MPTQLSSIKSPVLTDNTLAILYKTCIEGTFSPYSIDAKYLNEIPLNSAHSSMVNFLSDSQTMVSIDPKKNRYRIYSVEITKLRPYRVTTRWGRKTPKHRKPRWTGTKEKEFESIQTALKTYDSILNQKSKRGYTMSTASAL